jgi:hypothetical protein
MCEDCDREVQQKIANMAAEIRILSNGGHVEGHEPENEDARLAMIAARAAMIVSLRSDPLIPPSIILGEWAGMMLQVEIESAMRFEESVRQSALWN